MFDTRTKHTHISVFCVTLNIRQFKKETCETIEIAANLYKNSPIKKCLINSSTTGVLRKNERRVDVDVYVIRGHYSLAYCKHSIFIFYVVT